MLVGAGGRLDSERKALIWSRLDLRGSRREGAPWASLLKLNVCEFDSVGETEVC